MCDRHSQSDVCIKGECKGFEVEALSILAPVVSYLLVVEVSVLLVSYGHSPLRVFSDVFDVAACKRPFDIYRQSESQPESSLESEIIVVERVHTLYSDG